MRISKGVQGLYDALAIAAMRRQELKPGNFAGPVTGHVCLCGAVLAAVNGSLEDIDNMSGAAVIRRVARVLGITVDEAASLNNGFEGVPPGARYAQGAGVNGGRDLHLGRLSKRWYTIGKSLRRHWEKV